MTAAVALLAGAAGAGSTRGSQVYAARAGAAESPQVSSNWAGYAALAPPDGTVAFSDVTATWRQPKGRCIAGRTDSAAFWVGLGGFDSGSASLEQLGTEIDCSGAGKTPRYSAWWEIVPRAAVKIPLAVEPGDTIAAALLVQGQTVTMSMRNLTRRARFSKRLTVAQSLDVSSADWIAEAPSLCSSSRRCRVVPLSDFGRVDFSQAALTGNGHTGTVADPAWTVTPIELIAGGGRGGRFFDRGDPLGPGVGAVPGELGSDGRSFTITWSRSVTPPAS